MIYKLGTLIDIIGKLNYDEPLFTDTETVGLYGKVRLFQAYQAHWEQAVLVEWPNAIELMALLSSCTSVWHNSHYDLTCLAQETGIRFVPDSFEDTFLAARIAQPQYETYSLDEVMTRCVGYDPYSDAKLDKATLQKSDWGKLVLTPSQLLYAAIDVYHMPAIWEAVKGALHSSSYKLDISTVKSALDFQWNGMPIHSEKLISKYKETEAELATIHMPINANSWQQVRKWLDVEQSDKQALSELALRDGNTKAGDVLKVRQLRKLTSFMEKYDVERVYGKFKPSARSGRLTSDDENVQQIPRKLKCVFGHSKESGRTLIYSDYAQLELRTICSILGVRLMEQLFREGTDLHMYVAHILFGDTATKQDRQVTKTYNFNLLYGGSVNMVRSILITYGFWIEEKVASKHKAKWLNVFPEINKWQQECIARWRNGKLNRTPLGRQYYSKLMTDFMNVMNQGAGAEVAKLALHYFNPWLKEFNKDMEDKALLCNFIHDSFIIDSPDNPEVYQVVAEKLAECMQEAWFEMSKLMKIKDLPMPVDVKVGRNWGDLEEDENVDYSFSLAPYKMLEKVNAGC